MECSVKSCRDKKKKKKSKVYGYTCLAVWFIPAGIHTNCKIFLQASEANLTSKCFLGGRILQLFTRFKQKCCTCTLTHMKIGSCFRTSHWRVKLPEHLLISYTHSPTEIQVIIHSPLQGSCRPSHGHRFHHCGCICAHSHVSCVRHWTPTCSFNCQPLWKTLSAKCQECQ